MYGMFLKFAPVMAQGLRKLASETVVYGLSTILARILNFVFVPIYTRVLETGSYGTVTEFMAYIAVLQVILALGLETGCFRFASREGANPDKVFSNALAAVTCSSGIFLALVLAFAAPISSWLGYEGYEACVKYVAGILVADTLTSIFFARLRFEHKALKFAIFKTVKILTETGANLLLFFVFPAYAAAHPDTFLLDLVSEEPDFTYVIFAIFTSSIVCALLFVPMAVRQRYIFDRRQMKSMLVYSLPLMVAALPGIVNDFLDRFLFRFCDTSSPEWRSSLGIYQAATKLAVIMSLFIQMFRYAAEPFFFQREKDKGSKEMYAAVMNYFTAFCGLVFLGVIFYMDILCLILGPDYRAGVSIVPIMLGAYMLLGMLFNVSMWYKLSGKTSMAIYITLAGLVVTALVNIIFMPRYSYHASAWGHLASYAVMFVISAVLGQKYYPVPYNWRKLGTIVLLMLLCFAVASLTDSFIFDTEERPVNWFKIAVHTFILLVYAVSAYLVIRKNRKTIKDRNHEMSDNQQVG